jgi:hypothetical protein
MAFDDQTLGYNVSKPSKTSDADALASLATNSDQPQTVLGTFGKAVRAMDEGPKDTIATQLTGRNFLTNGSQFSGVMKTNLSSLSAGGNAAANVTATQKTTEAKSDITNLKADFKASVEAAQEPIKAALEESVTELNQQAGWMPGAEPLIDRDAARNSFMPAAQNNGAGLGSSVAVKASGAGPVVSAATNAADLYSQVKSENGNKKLPPKLENMVAAKMAEVLMRPDEKGQDKVSPQFKARIEEAAQQLDKNPQAMSELFKEALQPPEQMPEWTEMVELEGKIDQKATTHFVMKDMNLNVMEASRNTGVDASAVDVRDVGSTAPTVLAQTIMATAPVLAAASAKKTPDEEQELKDRAETSCIILTQGGVSGKVKDAQKQIEVADILDKLKGENKEAKPALDLEPHLQNQQKPGVANQAYSI